MFSLKQVGYIAKSGNHLIITQHGLISGIFIKGLVDFTVKLEAVGPGGSNLFTHYFDYSEDPPYVAPLLSPLSLFNVMTKEEIKEQKQLYGNMLAINVNLSDDGIVEIYEVVDKR